MILRGQNGWQTAMADLTLILFLVVAGAYRDQPEETASSSASVTDETENVDLSLGQPMAVFRPGGDANLTRWLGDQDLASGEVATVIVRHRSGGAGTAAADAARIVAEIERAGAKARLMVEPSDYPETLVVIAHDQRAQDGMGIAYTR